MSSVCARSVVHKVCFRTSSSHITCRVDERCKFSDLLRNSGGGPVISVLLSPPGGALCPVLHRKLRPRHNTCVQGTYGGKVSRPESFNWYLGLSDFKICTFNPKL